MQKRTSSVLWVAVIIAVLSVCGLALNESSGATAPIAATTILAGLVSTLIVRGLFKE
ncbi:MAG: hypothetical protein ACYS17_05655 [Planctomycetota bacterium]|jgi:hypothetical protein